MFNFKQCASLIVAGFWAAAPLAAADSAHSEFFEAKVRPLLSKHCFSCHTESRMGGLRMDTPENMNRGGNDGPVIVSGKPDQSLLVKAISYTDPRLKMPPGGKLNDNEIEILETWVREGAIWGDAKHPATPAPTKEYQITPQQRAFWSFQPVRKPAPPVVKERSLVRGPIDAFILAKLESKGLHPVNPAGKRTLIRRATMDLIGLPATSSEVEAFVNDPSSNAFEKVVDRLLESPHYGERWGRFWLDVARYSDYQLTAEGDGPLPNAFQYRDWVIKAFNDDMPYDQFVRAQIAGDQMPDKERYVGGLGFYSLSPKPEFREERVDATTRGFLGLTVACAECHDHKYDPIPTRDYYSLLGVFAATEPDKFPLAQADVVAQYDSQKKTLDEEKKVLETFLTNQRTQLVEIFADHAADYMMASRDLSAAAKNNRLEPEVLKRWTEFLSPKRKREYRYLDAWEALLEKGAPDAKMRKSAAEFQSVVLDALKEEAELEVRNAKIKARTEEGKSPKTIPLDREKFYLLKDLTAPTKKDQKEAAPFYFSPDEVGHYLSSVYKDYFNELRARIDRIQAALPQEYPYFPVIKDKAISANIHVYLRGNPETPGEEAPRRFLAILSTGTQVPFQKGSGRLELAESIASPANPLTARVMVNRIWQHHFSAGIVSTPSNFGKLGDPPTHPELLDYLASRFVENGWSIKKVHREIMLSATYQLSSDYSETNSRADPDNRLLWRANARRLDVEAIRDSLLFVSGNLDLKMGGPAMPLHDEKNHRRTIYAAISRAKPDAFLRLFDFPDPNETNEQRITTNVPLQQLFFLNSSFVRSQAESLMSKTGSGQSTKLRINDFYTTLFGRPPTPKEIKYGADFLALGNKSWIDYVEVLLSTVEFNYIS